jgi:hypothetical protein
MRKPRFVTFTVEGGGTFPFDMLRYDACYPDTEMNDSYKLDWQGQPGLRQVTLRHRVLKDEALHNYPSPRWPSFGWHVVPGSIRREE